MPKLYARIIKTVLVSYLFINAIIWAFSPTLVNHYLSEFLASKDLTLNDKSSIRYNPFISQIYITDLSIYVAEPHSNEGKIISVPTATLEFSLFKLFAKSVVIEKFDVDALEANVSLAITHLSSLQPELILDDSFESPPHVEDGSSEKVGLESADSGKSETEQTTNNWFMPHRFEMLSLNVSHSKVQFDLAGDEQVIQLNQLMFSDVQLSKKSQSGDISVGLLFNKALFEFDATLKLNNGVGELQYAFDLQKLDLSNLASVILKPLNSQYQNIDGLLSIKAEQDIVFNKNDVSSQIQNFNIILSELSLNQQQGRKQNDPSSMSFNIASLAIKDGVVDISLPHSLKELLKHTQLQEQLDNQSQTQPPAINIADDLVLRSNLNLEQRGLIVSLTRFPAVNHTSEANSTELINVAKLSIADIDLLLENNQTFLQTNLVELDNITLVNTKGSDANGNSQDDGSKLTERPLLQLVRLSLSDIKLSNNSLQVSNINITKVDAAITKLQNGNIVQLDSLTSLSEPIPTKVDAEKQAKSESNTKLVVDSGKGVKEKEPFNLYIGKVSLQDKLSFTIADSSVTPSYQNVIYINDLLIEPIDNSIPRVTSTLSVSGSLDEYSKFNIEADVKPFNKEKYIKADVTVSEFDLSTITTYLKDIVAIESGHLHTVTNFIIDGEVIKGNAKLNLSRVELAEAVEYDQANSIDTLIPVNVALSMLKDGDDNIELNVPVEGNLDDPDFRLSGFMALLVQRATMSATKSYLINAFVPYASIVQIGLQAGDFILKVRFQDLILTKGEDELPKSADAFLKQFSALMLDKKSTQITVCAMSTKADIGVEHAEKLTNDQLDKLNQLSLNRMKNFKNYMIDTHEIESSRLLLCAPKVDVTKNAKPRLIFTS
jgi:hypothetical protein